MLEPGTLLFISYKLVAIWSDMGPNEKMQRLGLLEQNELVIFIEHIPERWGFRVLTRFGVGRIHDREVFTRAQ